MKDTTTTIPKNARGVIIAAFLPYENPDVDVYPSLILPKLPMIAN